MAPSRFRAGADSVQYRLDHARPIAVLASSQISRLVCHPASPCSHVDGLNVVARNDGSGGLLLRFELLAAPRSLRLPLPLPGLQAADAFADGLWRHTCFEAFISQPHSPAYREFNFSPSGQWAAYEFAAYRERDAAWQATQAPAIEFRLEAYGVSLQASVPQALLPAAIDELEMGLSAVVEAADGALSYWALSHGAERPDFHLREAFSLRSAALKQHSDQP